MLAYCKQDKEGLAVVSIARDDPLPLTATTSVVAMFVWDCVMASTSLSSAAAVFPACTVTQCTSITDRRTLTSWMTARCIYYISR